VSTTPETGGDRAQELDLDSLEALAKAATPGPWRVHGIDVYTDDDSSMVANGSYCDAQGGENDTAFIAAANPQTVLELIRHLRAAGDGRFIRIAEQNAEVMRRFGDVPDVREKNGLGNGFLQGVDWALNRGRAAGDEHGPGHEVVAAGLSDDDMLDFAKPLAPIAMEQRSLRWRIVEILNRLNAAGFTVTRQDAAEGSR